MNDDDDQEGDSERARQRGHPLTSFVRAASAYTIDLIFPPTCAGCGRVGDQWCRRCVRETNAVGPLLSLPHSDVLTGAASTGPHIGKLREAVQALKYENSREIARFMARRMSACLDSLKWEFEVIVPVPIGQARLRERRYNQAGLITAALSKEVGVAERPALLWRTRETRSQVGLTAEERRQNVSGAFAAGSSSLAACSVLLIDDVFTTGATLSACASALRMAGATAVYALTVTAADRQ